MTKHGDYGPQVWPRTDDDCSEGCTKHRTCAASQLHTAIGNAEQAARRAHDLSIAGDAPFWTRWSLGRAQSILMHYVVKGASR